MANHPVTYTPTALAGIQADTTYFIQNTGVNEIRVKVAVNQPDLSTATGRDDAARLPTFGDLYPQPATNESVWVWAERGFSDLVYETVY